MLLFCVTMSVWFHTLFSRMNNKEISSRSKVGRGKRFLIFLNFSVSNLTDRLHEIKTVKPWMRQKPAARRKTYFFSDAHLGWLSRRGSPEELRLIRFLNFIQRDAEQIFIVGDLFDYWFEYKTVVPKNNFRLLQNLQRHERGIRVLFIAGNHDFWVKDYFRTELGMEVYLEPLETEISRKTVPHPSR